MDRKLSKLPLVCVLWHDAHEGGTGEHTLAEVQKDYHTPTVVRTFGLLLIDDEKGIHLASEITKEDEEEGDTTYRNFGFIPRSMVVEVINFGLPKRPLTKKPKVPASLTELAQQP